MPVSLSNYDIDQVCISIKNDIVIKYPEYKSHINFMYLYGCRIGELFEFRINYDTQTDRVSIDPQKGNNTRILPTFSFEVTDWIEEIQLTQNLFYLNKRNLQRIIEKVNPVRNLKCGNKNIGAHLFRHNWIKKRLGDGYTNAQLNEDLGYTNQTVADSYAISSIYYN